MPYNENAHITTCSCEDVGRSNVMVIHATAKQHNSQKYAVYTMAELPLSQDAGDGMIQLAMLHEMAAVAGASGVIGSSC